MAVLLRQQGSQGVYNYLFIYLAVGLSCSRRDLRCGMRDLLVAACMRDLFPRPGMNPGPLHWEHEILPTGPPGKSQSLLSLDNPLGKEEGSQPGKGSSHWFEDKTSCLVLSELKSVSLKRKRNWRGESDSARGIGTNLPLFGRWRFCSVVAICLIYVSCLGFLSCWGRLTFQISIISSLNK